MIVNRIDNIVPQGNYVLIKPYMDMRTSSNIEGVVLDMTFEEEKHAARVGEVIAVPEKLYYTEQGPDSLPWDTDMEIQVGDEVTYHFLSATTATDRHWERYVEFDGEIYIFVNYDRIFTAKRNGEIICLNGFVLVEPVEKVNNRYLPENFSFSDTYKGKDKYFGRVRFMGSLVRSYRLSRKIVHGPDQDDIKEGDLILMDKVCDIPLEYPFHAMLNGNKVYYRVQRRYIRAILHA